MAQKIHLSNTWCDEHLARCWQSYNEGTGENKHINYTQETKALPLRGYIYTGHRAGVFTYSLRKSQPLALPLDWQMAIEERESVDEYQDW